jgi:hypothetical protein
MTKHLFVAAEAQNQISLYKALSGNESSKRLTAIHSDLESLKLLNVNDEAKYHDDIVALSTKWVLCWKMDKFGVITELKARLVVRGLKKNEFSGVSDN